MPKELEKKLEKEASEKGLKGDSRFNRIFLFGNANAGGAKKF